MGDPFDSRIIQQEIREALQNNNQALAVAKIQEYLEKEKNTPLNIAVTGECGSGKSTLVNALRDIDNRDEGAAPTGSAGTTVEVTPYPHPNFPNVTLWDLPGIGTTNYPAADNMELVGFEKFDFFIIVSADRFRENDVKLAQEFQRMKKKFYFVRSKIDKNIRDEERSQREFSAERTLTQIRDNCRQGLQAAGVQSPQVFLVSSSELRLYDFPLLAETLERELPEHKRNALLLAISSNISLDMINKKKKAFHSKIKYVALLSAGVAGVAGPRLSIAVDVALLVGLVTRYVFGFGLDIPSLKRWEDGTGVPFKDLMKVIISPLAAKKITPDLVLKVVAQCFSIVVLMAADERSRYVPLLGIPAAMGLSFVTTYKCISSFLNMLADDAQMVFKRALGLNPAV
uniref:interferon-inducible GTPase 5-like n=1 Tax=Semicossyphus pulcher TaxID=241346 RepID=UPI0037E91B20